MLACFLLRALLTCRGCLHRSLAHHPRGPGSTVLRGVTRKELGTMTLVPVQVFVLCL